MTQSQLIALIAKYPQGLTTKQVVELTRNKHIGSRLSALCAYGKIDKIQVSPYPPTNTALWLPKANGAAP